MKSQDAKTLFYGLDEVIFETVILVLLIMLQLYMKMIAKMKVMHNNKIKMKIVINKQ